ncbi:thioredoxin TrxC [Bradyrhizobium sp. CCBAU 45384]|uniref:thioredoxin TrxC n=1 Tax=Bradyrhizobium sp. CCBAU 45384 TaxID=858428 RepID=UPI002304EA12|nr:thioredoxin TrxC [Bradyrhizobium sp. CCBAU 45384]MDA9406102.1 thioredoxin [Bradyrhizobium sp. CCBAU 45384]
MSTEARHIVCPHCTSINRIPARRDARQAKCGRCRQLLFTGHPMPVSTGSFATHIQRNDIPVVVDFWAAWCGPCKAMAPVFERAAGELEPELRFLKVDAEAEAELAARYNIQSIPTVMLFHKGNVVAQRAGAVGLEALRQWLRQHAPSAAPAAS